MKPKIILPVILLMFLVLFQVKQYEEKQLENKLKESKMLLDKKVAEFKTPQEYINSLSLSEIEKANWRVYSKKFILEKDEYLDSVWFTHNNFLKEDSKLRLTTTFNDKGKVKLISYFAGETPLQHYQFQLIIENQVYDSSYVLSNNDPYYEGKAIQFEEQITFEANSDIELLKKIAVNTSSEIIVRLIGKNAFKEYTLSENTKLGLKESWEFAKLMNNLL